MKYRQAKKIVESENRKGFVDLHWNAKYPAHQWMKAVITYVHHRKKTHLHFYESRGILRELRSFYETKRK